MKVIKEGMMCAVLCALPLAAWCGVLDVLPAPAADGAYELGAAGFSGDLTNDNLPSLAYVDWASLNVPSGATVRFVGGVLLDDLPSGYTYDWSALTHVVVVNNDALPVGTTFTVPVGVKFRFTPGVVAKDGASFTVSKDNAVGASDVPANIVMDGVLQHYDMPGAAAPCFRGAFTGSGTNMIYNWNQRMTFAGALDFAGQHHLGTTQNGQTVEILSSAPTSTVGTLVTDVAKDGTGAPQQIKFRPAGDGPHTLEIGLWNPQSRSKPGVYTNETYRRKGAILSVFSNNTVRIRNVDKVSLAPIGLFADDDAAYRDGSPPAFDKGFGNVIVENDRTDDNFKNAIRLYQVSPNLNLTLNGFIGQYPSTHPFVRYEAETNVLNRATLDMRGMDSASKFDYAVEVVGETLESLPRRIFARSGNEGKTLVKITGSTWTVPFDFSAAEACVARCVADGVLAEIPAAGTIVATRLGDAPPALGLHPLVTCLSVADSVAAALASWTIERSFAEWRGFRLSLECKADGIYLRVKSPKGFSLTFR